MTAPTIIDRVRAAMKTRTQFTARDLARDCGITRKAVYKAMPKIPGVYELARQGSVRVYTLDPTAPKPVKRYSVAYRALQLLKANPEGMTTNELMAEMGVTGAGPRNTLYVALRALPGVYVDRWAREGTRRGQYSAVWCYEPDPMLTPDDCPRPTK